MKKFSSMAYAILLALCCVTPLQSEIIETNEIRHVLKYVDPDSYVFFNITGTLYEHSTTLSSHQWREYFAARVNQMVPDKELGQKLINKIKNQIVQDIPKKNVQQITPQLIANLQEQKIVVLGITKKQISTPYADNFGLITRNHLLKLRINFEKTLSYFKIEDSKDINGSSFMYGILFTNKQPEGPALISFLNKKNKKPSLIIMVDDSLDALENVQTALEPTGIKFRGIRYSRTDAFKDSFDAVLGIIEFFAFVNEGKIMSDSEAVDIKQNNPTVNYELKLNEYIQHVISSYSKN